jgi:hypothetical protein
MQYKDCGNVDYSSAQAPLYNTDPVEGTPAFISMLDVSPDLNIVRANSQVPPDAHD